MLAVNAFKSDVKLSFYSGTAQQMGEFSVLSNESFMDAFMKMLFHPKITSQSSSRASALRHLDNFGTCFNSISALLLLIGEGDLNNGKRRLGWCSGYVGYTGESGWYIALPIYVCLETQLYHCNRRVQFHLQ